MISIRKPSANRTLIIIAIIGLMSIINPLRFPTLSNLISMSYQLPIIAFLSIGMALTMLSGGINLAIIATANFAGIITVTVLKALYGEGSTAATIGGTLLAMGGGLVAALLIGLIIGYLIAYVEVPAILATLAIMTLLNGVNVVITKGYTLSGLPSFLIGIGNGTGAGIPIPFIVFIVICIILAIVLKRTVFGVSLYLLGANPTAARYSNINVRRMLVYTYLWSAFFSALTSFIMMGSLIQLRPTMPNLTFLWLYWPVFSAVSILSAESDNYPGWSWPLSYCN